MKLINQILILFLLNGVYRIEIRLTNGKLDAHGKVMCHLTYLPSHLTKILRPKLNRLFLGRFLIVELVFDAEILRGCSLPCKFFKKLLFVFIGLNMS